jgi:tetratricopeptide (TPR) repeat protein
MSQESQAISDNISMLLTQGRTAEARAELERLLALDPEDPEGRSVAGDVYAYTGAHSAAYKQYNLAAETYNRLGRADKALAVHHKILELDAGMLDAATQTRLRLLALLVGAEDAIVTGQHDRAVAGFQEAIRQFPNHTITYQRLASLLVRMGRVDDAAAQYLTVARAFHAHGVHAKARPYFERVLELRPDHPEALERLMASLRSEGAEADGERFVKAAAVAHLQAGRNEEAAALFESLPEAQRDRASALGAALLLQSGEVGQAERMAAQLELARPELRDWFKRLGRAALERGDSVAADAYFRWAQGEAQGDAPVMPLPAVAPALAEPAPVEAVAPPPPAPAPAPPVPVPPAPVPPAPVAPKAPPPGLGAPPPPGLGVPPPPGLGAPPPPGLGVPPTPPAAAAPPPAPPAPAATQPSALAPAPAPAAAPAAQPPAFAPAAAPRPAPAPAAMPVISAATPSTEDQGILQTMGEMCLAEEMFEEAKQVFERLTKADPTRTQFWEQLNRARAGLGLSPMMPPAAAARPTVPLPVHLVATTQAPLKPAAPPAPAPQVAPAPLVPPAPPVPVPAVPAPARAPRPAVSIPPAPEPVLEAPAAPLAAAPQLPPPPAFAPAPEPTVWLPGMDPAPEPAPAAAPTPPPLPAPEPPPMAAPVAASAGAFKPVVLPRRPAVAPVRAPSRSLAPAVPAGVGRIEHNAYTIQLGELPPAVPSALDDADEIIE